MSAPAKISSASPRSSAPALAYSSSGRPLPIPAPFWTRTLCPAPTSTLAPAGTMLTRYSLSLISFGTPMIIADLLCHPFDFLQPRGHVAVAAVDAGDPLEPFPGALV